MKTKNRNLFAFCSASALASLLLPAVSLAQGVTVENIASGTTLRYPVALLQGQVSQTARPILTNYSEMTWVEQARADRQDTLEVVNLSSKRPSRSCSTPMFRNQFKAVVELVPGANRIRLQSRNQASEITLNYVPMKTPLKVRFIYLTDSSGGTRYDTQIPHDPQNYTAKIDTAAKLMQTFVAEKMNAQNLGRKTFALELDAQGNTRVHTLRAPFSTTKARSSCGEMLWQKVSDLVLKKFPERNYTNIVITAFSHYNAAQKRAEGHAALGGLGVAMVSNLGMCSWPSHIGDVSRAFADDTPINAEKVFDNTAFRSSLWSLASTTLGLTLHELGHALGFEHSNDPQCVMFGNDSFHWNEPVLGRGLDNFHRCFTLDDAPSRLNLIPVRHPEGEEAVTIARPVALSLSRHAWFSPNVRQIAKHEGRHKVCFH